VDFLTFCKDNYNEVTELEEDYMVLTDDEADDKAKEYILDSLWAFTPNFLASATGIDLEVFEAIQGNGRYESNNDAILRLVDDEDALVEEAIRWDGRGHFLSHYDGKEDSETVNGVVYFIYRQN
jgi:5-formaminoimidazole-4-carboxamide-1-beta-D-ribofuranosyl 5'-monophosphate synthetase